MGVTSNSGRRRRGTPHLARAEASASHRVKMASIFKAAADELRSSGVSIPPLSTSSPSFHDSSRRKRSYFPLSSGLTKRGSPGKPSHSLQVLDHLTGTSLEAPRTEDIILPNLRLQVELPTPPLPLKSPTAAGLKDKSGKEPLSSGFTSPVGPCVPAREGEIASLIAMYQDSGEDECHSTHRVPYVIAPRVAILTPQQHKPSIDAWLDDLVDPVREPSAQPSTKSGDVSSQSDTENGPERSSPTPCIVIKKIRGSTHLRTVRRPAYASLTAVQNPVYLNAAPRRPSYLDIPQSSKSLISPGRISSNKENQGPPTVTLSWSSVASSSPREPHHVNGRHLQSSAALAARFSSDKVDTISHPTFSTPSTLCSPSHRKKLGQLSTSSQNVSQEVQLRRTTNFATQLCSDDGLLSVVEFLTEETRDGSDEDSVEDRDNGAEVLPLSPEVERYRKGRGPRRERCTSYWDEDIVIEISPIREKVVQ